jgi:hypothetical protein
LLDPRGSLFGFRDLASARQISKLFAHGIALSEIIRSYEIREWLPEADLSNLRLHPATPHDLEIEQPEGRTESCAYKSNQCWAVCGRALRQCLIGRQSFCFILSVPLLLSKSSRHARESVGDEDRLKLSLTLPRPQTLLPGSRCIIDWLSAFLSEDIGSLLKRDAEVCQRQLVNEVLGPLVTEFARNLGREATTPI